VGRLFLYGQFCSWSHSLTAAVSLILDSQFPMFVVWGPQLAFLYNAAYLPLLDDKHPSALGAPIKQVSHDALLIAITSYGQQFDRDSAPRVRFDHYFVKPADPVELFDLLAQARRAAGERPAVAGPHADFAGMRPG
jgi:hypothetical protein